MRNVWKRRLVVTGCMWAGIMAAGATAQAATFVVTNTNANGPGSYFQATIDSNLNPGADVITFNIPGSGPHTVRPGVPLTDPVTIDGTTEPGYNGTPLIEINASLPDGNPMLGIDIVAGNTTVRGLAINRGEAGIRIQSNGGNLIERCRIGTDVTGTIDLGSAQDGITIENSVNNTSTDEYRTTVRTATRILNNVISGNEFYGINSGSNGEVAFSLVIQGNHIGTNAAGTAALGNFVGGILIERGATDNSPVPVNLIGGETAEARNVIAGNGDGVDLRGGIAIRRSDNNRILGNYIGVGADGTTAIGNSVVGIIVSGSNNTIGGTTSGARNVISATTLATFPGLEDRNGAGVIISGGSNNKIQGNYIGTDATGLVQRGNQGPGVKIQSTTAAMIGGTVAAGGNIIAGNGEDGITISTTGSTQASGNRVQGNRIGNNVAGAPMENRFSGIALNNVPNNFIGGTTAGAGNIIGPNGASGVLLNGNGTTGNRVEGNQIGSAGAGHQLAGVYITGAPANIIGGTVAGAGNTIAFNQVAGVWVEGAANNRVQANIIRNNAGVHTHGVWLKGALGTLIGGTTAGAGNSIGANEGAGVYIDEGSGGNQVQGNDIGLTHGGNNRGVVITASIQNVIGGTVPGARNIISGNTGAGVHFMDSGDVNVGTTSNWVQGNYIGTDATGTLARGNTGAGIAIQGNSPRNLIGGTTSGARNVIAGNGGHGVSLAGTSNNTVVQGNYIGTNAAGTRAVANNGNGIYVLFNAINCLFGGTTPGAGNVISGNRDGGISLLVTSNLPTKNVVQGNYIGTDATGTYAVGNGGTGIFLGFSPDNLIGGTTPGARNVISGNGTGGIGIADTITNQPTDLNLVQGNYIGVDINGARAIANRGFGISLTNSGATVGGTTANARNIISGNSDFGIFMQRQDSNPAQNTIQGNYIGTDVSGEKPQGNARGGIRAISTGILPGVTDLIQDNRIAFNTGDGVQGSGPFRLLRNAIFSNTELGIDLGANGVTANAPGDEITDFPVLTSVTTGAATVVEGTVTSPVATTLHVEFFSNRAPDPSGFGEGQTFIGSTDVNVAANVATSFRVVLPEAIPVGYFISATATNANAPRATSEFSQTVRVAQERTPPVVSIVSPTAGMATNSLALVRGYATDAYPGSGIARVELIIVRRSDNKYWNGAEWVDAPVRLSTILQGTSWYRNTAMPGTLEEGLYTIQAIAIDRAGNAATDTVNIIADRRAPVVKIDIPTRGEKLFYISLVRGTAIDPRDALGRAGSDIDRVELLIIRRSDNRYWNGQTWVSAVTPLLSILQGTTWYREEGLPGNEDLTPGLYTIQASAFDRAGNRAVDIINVTVPVSE